MGHASAAGPDLPSGQLLESEMEGEGEDPSTQIFQGESPLWNPQPQMMPVPTKKKVLHFLSSLTWGCSDDNNN